MSRTRTIRTSQRWSEILMELRDRLEKWGIKGYLLPGWEKSAQEKCVTVTIERNGTYYPITCRSQPSPEQNLKALSIAIHNVALAERDGIAFTMSEAIRIKALTSGTSPFQILGVAEGERDQERLRAAYRQKALETHPDRGGNPKDFIAVKQAAEQLGIN